MPHNPFISVSAVVLTNDDGEVALVRKQHTTAFIFPGGKPEPGETGRQAAIREVSEELGVDLTTDELEHLGGFTTPAANEAQTQLRSQVYMAALPTGQQAHAQAEIAQLIWVRPDHVEPPAGTRLAPLGAMVLKGLASGSFAARSCGRSRKVWPWK